MAPTLVSSVAMPLLPRLGRAIADKDRYAQTETVNEGLRLTSLIAMPVSAGLALYSKEILALLFKNESESITLCAPLLTVLAFSVSLSCLITLSNAILQAYGHPTIPLVAMAVGAAVKIVVAYFLIGNESINIMGAPISTFFCDLIINIIGCLYVCRYVPQKIDVFGTLIKSFAAAVLSVGASKWIYSYLAARYGDGNLVTFVCIGIAAFLYALLCIVFRIVNVKEIKLRRSIFAE